MWNGEKLLAYNAKRDNFALFRQRIMAVRNMLEVTDDTDDVEPETQLHIARV